MARYIQDSRRVFFVVAEDGGVSLLCTTVPYARGDSPPRFQNSAVTHHDSDRGSLVLFSVPGNAARRLGEIRSDWPTNENA